MERMDMHSRNEYLKTLVDRYLKADKRGKGQVLDEYCRNTGHNRKYVIRKIRHGSADESRLRRRRKVIYGSEVREALWRVWKMFDFPCGQRLKPVLVHEVERLRELGELEVSQRVAQKLARISSATIDRVLRSKKEVWKLGRKRASGGARLLAKRIPLRLTDWDRERVGYVEMDLVCHCGASTAGEYLSSLSAVEISSGWWEAQAVMGRAQCRIFAALLAIRERTPFTWRGIDSDNDQMFINAQLYRYCQNEELEFTRSRPNRKNDNAHIEQKNYTHVRRPLGYLRYDTDEELALINDLYENELRLYKNFFQPVMKMVSKQRVNGQLKRKYDIARTPYQRLLDSGQLSLRQQQALRRCYRTLNPAELKRRIDEKLEKLYQTYEKKRKRSVVVNPYKRQVPSTVTFSMIQQP
jgi:hypothetical protein